MERVYKIRGLNLATLETWDHFIGSIFTCRKGIEKLRAKRKHWKTNPVVYGIVRIKKEAA